MTLTQYTIHHARHLVPTLIASVVFNAFWVEFGRSQPVLGASLAHTVGNFVLYVPLSSLTLLLFGYWLHETDRASYEVQLALVSFGVRLGQVYRVVLVWLVLVFAVLVWLSWQG